LREKRHNNRINPDWQFRCAPLPAGYAERSASWRIGFALSAVNKGNKNKKIKAQ
jgi:hypothetical protein